MTLQERLAAAAEARRRAAGLPPDDTLAGPDDPDASIDLTMLAPVIDLRPAEERRFSKALKVAGRSDVCPTCGTPDPRLDMEDIVGGVDHYSCLNCGQLFQVGR
jgi:hypothetical protein